MELGWNDRAQEKLEAWLRKPRARGKGLGKAAPAQLALPPLPPLLASPTPPQAEDPQPE